MPKETVRIVYSTEAGFVAPHDEKPVRRTKSAPTPMPDDGVVRVTREKRRASSATVVYGVPAARISALGAELRKLCGTGGTTKAGAIELQGDHRDKVIAHLTAGGYRVKRAGG